jgi:hypothetical protein
MLFPIRELPGLRTKINWPSQAIVTSFLGETQGHIKRLNKLRAGLHSLQMAHANPLNI